MSGKLLLVGDSHSHTFAAQSCIVNYQDESIRNRPITAKDFTDSTSWCWEPLDAFLKLSVSLNNNKLILCVNEVDIRAHYWKHLVEAVAQGDTVESYVQNLANKLYESIKSAIRKYNLEWAVLWGTPPASPNNLHHVEFPYMGSVTTRNIIIHMFNCAFNRAMKDDNECPNIGFATAFYEYINLQTYQAKSNFSLDGVHYADNLRPGLWEVIKPVLRGEMRTNIPHFEEKKYGVVPQWTTSSRSYSSWVSEKYLTSVNSNPRYVNFNDETYHLLTMNDDLPNEYYELGLCEV